MMPTNEGHVAIGIPSSGKVSGITDILKIKKGAWQSFARYATDVSIARSSR
jgi:hypothetical protein